MRIFNAGIVGAGFIGAAHIEALRRLGNVQVAAIADNQNAEEKASLMNIPNWFEDYKAMIKNVEIDVLHICTPNNTHFEIAKYALEHGVNVVCEKPMTTSVQEAKELLEIATEKNLVHAVNFHNRFNPMTFELKKIIKDNELGDIITVHGAYLQDWLLFDTDYNWRINPKESGRTRAVADLGSHWMDLVEITTGLKITEVFSEFTTYHKKRKRTISPSVSDSGKELSPAKYEEMLIETEDVAFLMFKFNNGAKGSGVISQMFAGRKNKISVFISGSKKSAEWDTENIDEIYMGSRNKHNEVILKDPNQLHEDTKGIVDYPAGHVEGFPDTFKQCFTKVYKAIDEKTKITDYATFEDGLRSMILCEKVFESAAMGKWVKV